MIVGQIHVTVPRLLFQKYLDKANAAFHQSASQQTTSAERIGSRLADTIHRQRVLIFPRQIKSFTC